MGVIDIVLLIVYLLGYIGHIGFSAYIADEDKFAYVFVGIVSGLIWFIIDPIIFVALSGDL